MTRLDVPPAIAPIVPPPLSRRAERRNELASSRSIISAADRRSPRVRIVVIVFGVLVLGGLVVISVGPLFWLFKAATSTTTETLAQPLGLWPSSLHWENFAEAFNRIHFGGYLLNTLWVCLGTWFFSLIVATTGGYALAVLRPRYAKVIEAAVLATLFVPGVISLVSLYLTIVDIPLLGINLVNTFWAVWLPASANAFNVLLVQRFFAGIPGELYEAAELDGAGPIRVFWSIVLPLSKPIIGVVSLLSIVAAYKDFLWPLLVLPADSVRPLSVALPLLESGTDLSVFLAALFASIVIPVSVFLIFQRQFISAAGTSGALKG
ncbi:carbohydrate ABC transporter permease [Subtercola endophyticus]|uniref:carbohydrate ABC transporter permease n=1 Tax=Subtercola endophyticus TaxID=2895559 RepID=UPI001E54385C|nr:carbohydrate ABC transporter permease [Subtercola endophyticus]UFS60838.1 carbohydrate ABC transporter permease [Subtercola endophyticus]